MTIELTAAERQRFAEEFLTHFLAGGFGSMSKREIEILVFHLLGDAAAFKALDVYQRANELRTTEARVRNLRAESSQRYARPDHKAALYDIAQLIFERQSVTPVLEQGKIVLVLDDPTLRREFEYAATRLGVPVDYSFNRNILRVDPATFIAIFSRTYAFASDKLVDILKRREKDKSRAAALTDKSLSAEDRVGQWIKRHENVVDALKTVIGIIKP